MEKKLETCCFDGWIGQYWTANVTYATCTAANGKIGVLMTDSPQLSSKVI